MHAMSLFFGKILLKFHMGGSPLLCELMAPHVPRRVLVIVHLNPQYRTSGSLLWQ